MFKISNLSRIMLAIGAVSLLGMLKLPIWRIILTAPQYPEGLEMKIWHNTLSGDVAVISKLNHYIGMREISAEMFPEFEIIGALILIAAGICLILALIGRWWSALAYWFVLALGDTAALYDFWRWGYDYGHNLDPTAPIVIPGMAYQPPVIGYKVLLNFEAWSLPDLGGWILMTVTALSLFIVVWEWWKNRRARRGLLIGLLLLAALFMDGCQTGPRPIKYGSDGCYFCKMTLMDHKYGAEIVTKKGKVYVFDDLNCLVNFEKMDALNATEIAGRYVADFSQPGQLMDVTNALFLNSPRLQTPMASQTAAFPSEQALKAIQSETGGEIWDWSTLIKEM